MSIPKVEDFSSRFSDIRLNLIHKSQMGYPAFRNSLTPKYLSFRINLLATLIAFLLLILFAVMDRRRFIVELLEVCFIGVTLHRLSLFFHEAAHNNFAKKTRLNDLFANMFIGIFLLDDIRRYRPIHLRHHRFFGTFNDPVDSYLNVLNIRFLAEGFLGIRAFKVIRQRSVAIPETGKSYSSVPLIGATVYLGISTFAFVVRDNLNGVVVIFIGVCMLYPLITGVRELLEHRGIAETAKILDKQIGNSKNCFAITRNFSSSFLSPIIGAAGSSRHLIHHWDPSLHYTCLPKMHMWLNETQLHDVLEKRSCTYFTTFRDLWNK